MPNSLDLKSRLAAQREHSLYRARSILESPQGPEVHIDGDKLLSFCSNDYLGLANHPAIKEAFRHATDTYGVGSGASHLISGHSRAHHALEEELADFLQCERTLLFSTGYMANIGVVTALAERHGVIYEDRANHASLIDAARLARSRVTRYPHGAVSHLQELLTAPASGSRLITTDGVFSMDGDIAPLSALIRLANVSGARLIVDDAHGIGVIGASGRGSLEHCGELMRPPVVLVGTLGKAFGTFGAFVAGEADLIEVLIQHARTYVYTTALPPAVAEATRASLNIIRTESWRRERLRALIARFRQGASSLGFQLMDSETPIQPLILGGSEQALLAAQRLRAAGLLVPAIRPPTVPDGSARLRVTLSSDHHDDHVERLLATLAELR